MAVRILLLEDSENDATLVQAELELNGIAAEVVRVESMDAFETALREQPPQLVLADYSGPAFDGIEALEHARRMVPEVPFIFVTGALGEERAIEVLKLGATDYVVKHRLERLGRSVERALTEAREKRSLREAQDALRESERTLSTLMSNMPGMAFRCLPRPPWTLEYASAGAFELTGYTPDELRTSATTWSSLIHPADLEELRGQADGPREVARANRYRIRTRSGEERWVLERSVGVHDADGELIAIEGFVTDITQQVHADLEAKRQSELEQQLIGIVSHDLRGPLNVVVLASATALHTDDLDPKLARLFLKIKAAGDRAARMIRDLLDFTEARIGGGINIEPRQVDLLEVVNQVVEDAETTQPGREIRVHHAAALSGHWDRDRLEQVLQNLVSNALRHSEPSTAVTIRTAPSGGDALVEVHNHGEPIPDDVRDRIFQPMQRGTTLDRSARSVGLGLYIVQSIVRAHGGTVEFESAAGHGTTFRIRIPFRAAGAL